MNNKVQLYQKIQQVSIEDMNLEKDMEVGSGNFSYKAVSDTQVTLAVKRAEEKNKIVSIPTSQELVNSEVLKRLDKNNKETITYVDTIKMTLTIIDIETGESIQVESFGKGIDSGDKGFGKASTYARKYALLNAYKIATGEDPDAVKSEAMATAKTVSEKRKIVIDFLNNDTDRLNKALEHFGAGTSDDLSDKDIETMYSSYKQKRLI